MDDRGRRVAEAAAVPLCRRLSLAARLAFSRDRSWRCRAPVGAGSLLRPVHLRDFARSEPVRRHPAAGRAGSYCGGQVVR